METYPEPTFLNEQMIAGRYRVLRLLGSGGYGKVYAAWDPEFDRNVAVKVLRATPGDAREKDHAARFSREAKALSRLDHKNIVRVHRVGVLDDGSPYLVMDLIEGESLSKRLAQAGPFNCRQAAELCLQIAEALAHAHGLSILHRDIKPENILLEKETDGSLTARLVDFGLTTGAMRSEASTRVTRTGDVLGTPYYMSPEQCEGNDVDARSDIYSLGCLFFAMLTGHPPFQADSVLAMLWQQVHDPLPSLRAAQGNAKPPALLEQILGKCTAKRREDRYSSCAQLIDDLQKLRDLNCLETFASQAAATIPTESQRERRSQLKFGTITGALAITVLTLLWFIAGSPIGTERIADFVICHAPESDRVRILDALDACRLPVADAAVSLMESALENLQRTGDISPVDQARLSASSKFLLTHATHAQLQRMYEVLNRYHRELKLIVQEVARPVWWQVRELQVLAQETALDRNRDWGEDTIKCYLSAAEFHTADKSDKPFEDSIAHMMQLSKEYKQPGYLVWASNLRCMHLFNQNRLPEARAEFLRGDALVLAAPTSWPEPAIMHQNLGTTLQARGLWTAKTRLDPPLAP